MWSEERKKVEKVILELVRLSRQARAIQDDIAASSYEEAVRILRREFSGIGAWVSNKK